MSPEYLQNLSQELIDMYTATETELLNSISKKIGQNKSLFIQVEGQTSLINDWQLDRLAQLDGLTKDNIKIIAKGTGKTEQEISHIFAQAVETSTKSDEALISEGIKKGLLNTVPPIGESIAVKNALSFAENTTLTTFNEINNSMLRRSNKAYVDTVNQVTTNVLAGIQTPNQAMVSAVKTMSKDGIPVFVASNGAKWSAEAYTSMVIKSNVKSTINVIQDARIREAGGEYIEINAYGGARPKCADDQGQVYSLDGNTEPIKDLNGDTVYPRDWADSSYGEADGILGINCGHQRFMFVPELSGFDREKIKAKENDDIYKEKQQQRYLERDIRNAKREKLSLENAKTDPQAIKKAQSKISARQESMREFIDKTDRNRNYAREKVI